LNAIEATRRRLHVFAVLDTLVYARRSGRIPAALTIFGGLLHVKPMIELTNGEVKAVDALRTTSKANDRMRPSSNRADRLKGWPSCTQARSSVPGSSWHASCAQTAAPFHATS